MKTDFVDTTVAKVTKPKQAKGEVGEPNPYLLISRLMDFDKPRIQQILKDAGLNSVGTRADLKAKIEKHLKAKHLTYDGILEYILEWEGWTHRHCILIQVEPKSLVHLKDEANIAELFKAANLEGCLVKSKKYSVPQNLTMDSVRLTNNKLIVTFIAPVYKYETTQSYIDPVTQIRHREDHLTITRKVYVVELNLKTGSGFMTIPSVQRGKTYSAEFLLLETQLRKVLGCSFFQRVQIESAIKNLLKADESTPNSLHLTTSSNRRIQVKSPNKKTAVFDETTKSIEKAMKGQFTEGGFYHTTGKGTEAIRYKIYDDCRFGVFSDLDEDDFRALMELIIENV